MFNAEQVEQQQMSVLEKVSKMSTANSGYRQASVVQGINYARRRALAIVILVIAALAVVFSISQTQAAGATSHAGKANFTYVYVAPGDTLWSIATKYAPDRDPQQEITDIQNLNALSSSNVVPGQRLALP